MVREIIHISVGKCGNSIGNEFWDMLCTEHNISLNDESKPLSSDKLHVYFNESKENQHYRARSCIIDLEPESIDNIKASRISSLFHPDNMLCGHAEDTYNPYYAWHIARSNGDELQDDMLDVIRKEAESCDCVQGFQMTHSASESIGGGVGCMVFQKLRDKFPGKILTSFPILPGNMGKTYTMSEIDAYFAILTLYYNLENTDITFLFDNTALYNICCNTLQLKEPTQTDMNWLIANAMSSITAPFRCKTSNSLNSDMRRMAVNLIPYYRLHFLSTTLAPIYARNQAEKCNAQNVSDIESTLWNSTKNCLSNIDATNGKYLTTSLYFRGVSCSQFNDDTFKQFYRLVDPRLVIDGILRKIKISQTIAESVLDLCGTYMSDSPKYLQEWNQNMYQFEFDIKKSQKKMMDDFVTWIPHANVTSTLIEKSLFANDMKNCVESSGIMVANTTASRTLFKSIYSVYDKLLKREGGSIRAGGYTDKQEHMTCGIEIRNLITEYQDKQDAVVDLHSDDESEDYDDSWNGPGPCRRCGATGHNFCADEDTGEDEWDNYEEEESDNCEEEESDF